MNRSVLITGAGRGLGLYVAKKHLEKGDHVYALCHHSSKELEELRSSCPVLLTISSCDLGNTEEVQRAMMPLLHFDRKLDILYNIAGLFFPSDRVPLEETDLEKCMLLFNINSLGPLRIMQCAIPLLKPGTVVMNVSSECGSVGECNRDTEYGYCMSKSALNMASMIFANRFRKDGIRVFCYHPGWMKTDMGGEGARLSDTSLSPEEAADAILSVSLNPKQIPPDVMFINYEKRQLGW